MYTSMKARLSCAMLATRPQVEATALAAAAVVAAAASADDISDEVVTRIDLHIDI